MTTWKNCACNQSKDFLRKLVWIFSSLVMKKNITWTVVCIMIVQTICAQGNSYSDLTKLGTLSKSQFDPESIFGKNFYFEGAWVKAKLLKSDNSVLSNDSFLYNFDKIDRTLFITTPDYKNIFQIDYREFKAIVFYVHDSAYLFKHLDFINDKDLFQILINGKEKYSLCKVTRTKLIRFYNSMGLQTTKISPLDKYEDINMYYIFFPNKNYKRFFLLKRSALQRIFRLEPDGQKVSEYLDLIGKKDLNENDLEQMINYLNN
jgi:hypothetical protein